MTAGFGAIAGLVQGSCTTATGQVLNVPIELSDAQSSFVVAAQGPTDVGDRIQMAVVDAEQAGWVAIADNVPTRSGFATELAGLVTVCVFGHPMDCSARHETRQSSSDHVRADTVAAYLLHSQFDLLICCGFGLQNALQVI